MSPATITLTHANLKEPIDLAVALIAGWYTSPGNKCTHVVSTGGAVFPALETREQITRLRKEALEGALTTTTKEGL